MQQMKQQLKENAKALGVFLLFVALLYVLHIGCPIKFITGLSCPGCGLTRAWVSFLTLDPVTAMEYHPLFWMIPFIFAIFIGSNYISNKKVLTAIVVVLIVCFVVVWVIRLCTDGDMQMWILLSNMDAEPSMVQNGFLPDTDDIVNWTKPLWLSYLQGLF